MYLLPGSELLSPLLYLLGVLLIQLLQFLGLVFNQQVAFLILKGNVGEHVIFGRAATKYFICTAINSCFSALI